jgi:hypothetical protein
VTLDLGEFLANVVWRDELVKDVPLLDTAGWQVTIIILKGFDYDGRSAPGHR